MLRLDSTASSACLVSVLDYNAMITVETERHGVHNTKPLGVIWAKFPEHYHPKNTLHVRLRPIV